jgi:cellulose synthase/poly-beta-1,6-N-acetylglucosamine synthase-like glycosyltransferase
MENVFWIAAVFSGYTYLGYPVLIWLLSFLRPAHQPGTSSLQSWPPVTVVVAVYNEREKVARKIQNLQTVDYDPGLIKIVFVSDGSSDGTNEVVRAVPGVHLLSYDTRRGKPHALNHALANIESGVVVFTDVRQELDPDAVRHLVARLMQPGIGAVSGELVHRDPQTHAASHIGLYWRYEKWIRKAESRFASTVGVTGALYAIRREDYVPLPEDTLLDDMVVPMHIVMHGRRAVLEPRAIIYDDLQQDAASERKRKVRTLTGNFQMLVRYPWLFVPWKNPVFVQYMSHKVFRLFLPYALLAMFMASLLTDGTFYSVMAACQAVFYLLSLSGYAVPAWRRHRLISFAVVFLEMNWAAVLALHNYFTGRVEVRWVKT